VYPALRKGKGREGRASKCICPQMYHIYQRCLSRTAPHLVLPCNPQMSGTDSGPSAATMLKESREKKRQRERQRIRVEEARRATEGAGATDPAGSSGVGQVLTKRFVLDCFNSRLLMACATGHAGRAEMAKARGKWEKSHRESAASLDVTASTQLTDESGSEHVDGKRRSHIYACQNLIRGGKSSVCSWRLKIRAQQVRSAAATMAARLAAV
jgi:hypothetical protein